MGVATGLPSAGCIIASLLFRFIRKGGLETKFVSYFNLCYTRAQHTINPLRPRIGLVRIVEAAEHIVFIKSFQVTDILRNKIPTPQN